MIFKKILFILFKLGNVEQQFENKYSSYSENESSSLRGYQNELYSLDRNIRTKEINTGVRLVSSNKWDEYYKNSIFPFLFPIQYSIRSISYLFNHEYFRKRGFNQEEMKNHFNKAVAEYTKEYFIEEAEDIKINCTVLIKNTMDEVKNLISENKNDIKQTNILIENYIDRMNLSVNTKIRDVDKIGAFVESIKSNIIK